MLYLDDRCACSPHSILKVWYKTLLSYNFCQIEAAPAMVPQAESIINLLHSPKDLRAEKLNLPYTQHTFSVTWQQAPAP